MYPNNNQFYFENKAAENSAAANIIKLTSKENHRLITPIIIYLHNFKNSTFAINNRVTDDQSI